MAKSLRATPAGSLPDDRQTTWRDVAIGYVWGCRVGMPFLTLFGLGVAVFGSFWIGAATAVLGLVGFVIAWLIDLRSFA